MMVGDIVRIKRKPEIIGVITNFVNHDAHLKAVVRIPIREDGDKGYYEAKIFEAALEKVEKAKVR